MNLLLTPRSETSRNKNQFKARSPTVSTHKLTALPMLTKMLSDDPLPEKMDKVII